MCIRFPNTSVARVSRLLAATLLACSLAACKGNNDSDAVSDDAPNGTGNAASTIPDENTEGAGSVGNTGNGTFDGDHAVILTSEQSRVLPNDCLLATDGAGVVYCFSPTTRDYIAVLPDGSTRYQFPLPGDNASNHVEGIVATGASEAYDICIVADVSAVFGYSQHEISCFTNGGQFTNTSPTLVDLPTWGRRIKPDEPLGINLDGESLQVIYGGFGLVVVAGNRYEHLVPGDATDPGNWAFHGSFVAALNPFDGALIAWHDYPGQRIDRLQRVDGATQVTVGDTIYRLDSDLGPPDTSLPAARAQLAPDRVARLMPRFMALRSGETIATHAAEWQSLIERLGVEPVYPSTPGCQIGVNVNCNVESIADPVEIACTEGGSASMTARQRSEIYASRTYTTIADWQFDNCRLANRNHPTSTTVNGRISLGQRNISSTSFEGTVELHEFENWQYDNGIDPTVRANGTLSVLEQNLSDQGVFETERKAMLDWFEVEGVYRIDQATLGEAHVQPRDEPQTMLHDPAGTALTFRYRASSPVDQDITLETREALSAGYITTESGTRSQHFRGELALTASDGTTVSIDVDLAAEPGSDAVNGYYGGDEEMGKSVR